jgi:AraC family transcriptional regulator of adaptative response/methylated-DNA-[protein]-cysteine methyltransferase
MRDAGLPEAEEGRYADDESRWSAVARRDPAADGRFWFSVRTTGVYCRPSCPARRARRENVRFHPSPGAAERAGFRACRRCRPRDAEFAQRHRRAVARACRAIASAEREPSLAELARAAGLSPSHFQRLFRSQTGLTPKRYAAGLRARRFEAMLSRGARVSDAIAAAGFGSSGRMYAGSNARLGMTPREFRAGGEGVALRFAVRECSLGLVLVGATDKGVCAILLGNGRAALERDLRRRFPRAQILEADTAFERLVARAIAQVEHPARPFALPLDLRGSVFELAVWEALRRIPPGSTASYSDVARRIGRPHAARAVARACAANPLAVAIPCHRVVRADGSRAGYRWGPERKRALLEREKRNSARAERVSSRSR